MSVGHLGVPWPTRSDRYDALHGLLPTMGILIILIEDAGEMGKAWQSTKWEALKSLIK